MSGRPIPGGYETWSKEDELRAQLAAATQENAALLREVAGLRYYIAQLERNVTQEERAYAAGIASLMLSQYDIDNVQPRE